MLVNQQQSFSETAKGKLYLIPTPIGNLEDMTFRSVRMLKEVDLIASEDTRNTIKLLNHFEVSTSQISFHEHNTEVRVPELIGMLLDGKNIAQVSDAGMPSISDPGVELVQAAISQEIPVIPLPGANAALTGLIASGLAPQPFYFYGFPPRKKKELKQTLEELNYKKETLVFYESPYRIKKFITALLDVYDEKRKLVLARELTKKYEEFLRGTIGEVKDWVEENEIRGEFVVFLEGNEDADELLDPPEWEEWTIKDHVNHLMEYKGIKSKAAIKEVAQLRELPKREVYSEYHEI